MKKIIVRIWFAVHRKAEVELEKDQTFIKSVLCFSTVPFLEVTVMHSRNVVDSLSANEDSLEANINGSI
jgi:hypothetical protein